MNATLKLADGRKVRCASQRRFILVEPRTERPFIVRRSDNLDTLRRVASTCQILFDTATKPARRWTGAEWVPQ